MAVNINVPSQVKTYANLAAFPASGALKTIYIAEDTNKTYRWTGSVYTEISATAASTWGAIGGTLSNQTDLQTALNAKQNSLGYTPVPETRTLTINGTTQDLSADRTFTISTGITIGTTLITSGTVGRVLFEGTGNVVQESANLFWDNTNVRLGVGTSSPAHPIDARGLNEIIKITATGGGATIKYQNSFGSTWNAGSTGNDFYWLYNGVSSFMTLKNNGNVLINTTTDAGFKLDVNGTARATKVVVGASTASPYQLNVWGGAVESYISLNNTNSGNLNTDGFQIGLEPNGTDVYFINRENGFIQFRTNNLDRFRIFSTGNIGINTTTDAGFRLDVNGTARVSGALTLGTGTAVASSISYGATYGLTMYGNTGSNSDLLLTDRNGNLRFRIVNGGNILQTATTINDVIIGGTSFASKSVYTSPVYGLTLGGSAGSIFNFSLLESTGNNGLFIDSSGNTKIGVFNSTYNSSAILEAVSTTKGFLKPRLTTTQKNAIASPAAGLEVYDTTLNRPCFYDGTTWITL